MTQFPKNGIVFASIACILTSLVGCGPICEEDMVGPPVWVVDPYEPVYVDGPGYFWGRHGPRERFDRGGGFRSGGGGRGFGRHR